jgi:hypothetical protein
MYRLVRQFPVVSSLRANWMDGISLCIRFGFIVCLFFASGRILGWVIQFCSLTDYRYLIGIPFLLLAPIFVSLLFRRLDGKNLPPLEDDRVAKPIQPDLASGN